MANLYDVGAVGAGFVPGSGILDMIGQAPAIGGGMGPSFVENLKRKQYMDALMQMVGAAGDVAMVVPPVGLGIKGVATAGKTARAAGKAAKAPRMSKAASEAAGYWHDIGAGKKLPVPIGEMKAERQVIKNLEPAKVISPEQMQGSVLMPLSGDRSIAGQLLTGVGDVKLPTPVELEGGPGFMRTHSPTGAVWASDVGATQGLMNRIMEAANQSPDVYGVYSAMGHGSMNFNTMMSDALLEQIKGGKITKKAIKEFDKSVRELRPEWKGLMSDEARAQLENNGALRHAFVNRMQLDEFQNAGFPNIAYTRYALTEPSLLDAPLHSSGFSIAKMSPTGEIIKNPSAPHKTYNTQLPGQYVGGLEQSVPREVMFPDWYKERRQAGLPTSADPRSFMLANPIQKANQEWLDGLMSYLESQATR